MCEEQTTPTDTQSLDEKVAAWVTASGRGTEMATARAARDAGAVAIQSVPFVDPVTGKDREVDVLAEFEESAGPPCPDGEPTVRQVDYARVRTPSTGNAVLVHVMGLSASAHSLDKWLTFKREMTLLGDQATHPAGVTSRPGLLYRGGTGNAKVRSILRIFVYKGGNVEYEGSAARQPVLVAPVEFIPSLLVLSGTVRADVGLA